MPARWVPSHCPSPPPLTQAKRETLLAQLDQSSKTFLKPLDGVSDQQWRFKPGPDRWSIAECAEHVAVADRMTFVFASQKLVNMPAPASPKRVSDDVILKAAVDRAKKVKTAGFPEPAGRYATRAAVIEAFQKSRADVIGHVTTTADDLRGHGIEVAVARVSPAASRAARW